MAIVGFLSLSLDFDELPSPRTIVAVEKQSGIYNGATKSHHRGWDLMPPVGCRPQLIRGALRLLLSRLSASRRASYSGP